MYRTIRNTPRRLLRANTSTQLPLDRLQHYHICRILLSLAWIRSSIKIVIRGWNRLKRPTGEPCTSPDSWMYEFWAGESWSSVCVWMVCWLLIARIARQSNFKLIDAHISNSKHAGIAKLRERVICTLELVQRWVLLPLIDQPRRKELINFVLVESEAMTSGRQPAHCPPNFYSVSTLSFFVLPQQRRCEASW